ncbi:hypothetical protein HCMG_01555 [Helicobacter canadensis MIT 98-5491]|nr:hypothetical protein HCMG_01555 [Helicobacter canadensis MIT 98-5491]
MDWRKQACRSKQKLIFINSQISNWEFCISSKQTLAFYIHSTKAPKFYNVRSFL